MLDLLLLFAQTNPTWDAIKELGIPVACLVLGAAGTYKFGVVPERQRYEREREDRITAQAAWKEAYEVTTPALVQANTNSMTMLGMIQRGETK